MSDIYLHVGLGKTGSSSLQAFFSDNISTFSNIDLFYPTDLNSLSSGNGHLLTSAIERNDITFFLSLKDHLYSIFSREHFAREFSSLSLFSTLSGSLESHFKPNQIHVIVYIRNPDHHCYSLWSQKIKNSQSKLSLRKFSLGYDSYTILSQFLGHVRKRNWIIHLVDYDQNAASLIPSFFSCFHGLNTSSLSFDHSPYINESPSSIFLLRKWVSLNLFAILGLSFSPSSLVVRLISSFFAPPSLSNLHKCINHQWLLYNVLKSQFFSSK